MIGNGSSENGPVGRGPVRVVQEVGKGPVRVVQEKGNGSSESGPVGR